MDLIYVILYFDISISQKVQSGLLESVYTQTILFVNVKTKKY